MDREAELQIKQLEKTIKEGEKELKDAQKDLNFASYKIAKNTGIKASTINDYVKMACNSYSPKTPIENRADLNAYITDKCDLYPDLSLLNESCQQYAEAEFKIEKAQIDIEEIKSQQAALEANVEETAYVPAEVPDGTGHLYPIALVTEWTNKLNFYNAMLDDFIKKIDEADPLTIDITWLMKKCEWVCRKINYALALLRYNIIKCLNKIYLQVQDMLPIIGVIANAKPSADPGALLKPVKGVVDLYIKPYKTAIDFITDFTSYTPKLITAAAALVSKASTIPSKLLNKIEVVAKDQTDNSKKELVEVYKQYLSVKMEPITLGDIQSGAVEKPSIAEFSGNKQLFELTKGRLNKTQNDIKTWRSNFIKKIEDAYKDSLPQIETLLPLTFSILDKDEYEKYYMLKTNKIVSQMEAAMDAYEIGKLKQKAQEAKQKAIEKAEKAKKLAERNAILAAKDILNEEQIKEAEQAKIDAQKALEEANNISTDVEIPWGTSFNSSRYPLCPYVSTQKLAYTLKEYDTILDEVEIYYYAVYVKGTAKQITDSLQYVTFVTSFSKAYQFIDEELANYKDLIIEYYKTKEEMNSLNKRSIFK